MTDPFKNLVLDEYEQEIEDYLASGNYKSSSPKELEKTKKAMQKAAKKYFEDKKKDEKISLRLKASDLNTFKQKAHQRRIPYQTLLTALIHQYNQGKIKLEL